MGLRSRLRPAFGCPGFANGGELSCAEVRPFEAASSAGALVLRSTGSDSLNLDIDASRNS